MEHSILKANTALNLAASGLWTLRDKAPVSSFVGHFDLTTEEVFYGTAFSRLFAYTE